MPQRKPFTEASMSIPDVRVDADFARVKKKDGPGAWVDSMTVSTVRQRERGEEVAA